MRFTLFFALSLGCISTQFAQSYEVIPNTKDTINFIDELGKKQGKWVLFGKHKPNTCYAPSQKAEEGAYKENRKTGIWMEYFCNGNTKNKVTFVNGRPDGYAVIFHENGKVEEEGQWKNNRWVGGYKQYYENGQVQHEFKFNASGKREGVQTYVHPNGEVAIQGNFVNGKEAGTVKEFYENGELKAEKKYDNGNVDVASIKTYESKEKIVKKVETPDNAPKITIKDEKPATTGPMVLNGKQTLYNKSKQITKDGIFKDNRFMEGKAFIYNDNGILTQIAVYKGGIYVGDAPIEN